VPEDVGPSPSVESLYAELHRLAEQCMLGQPPGHTLQTTALVHEAYLRLAPKAHLAWEDRARFLATAAKAMRHVLVDHARARSRRKRTPPGQELPLDRIVPAYEDRAHDLVALDEALERLAAFDAPMAQAVELRFFGGISFEECARVLGLPLRTFERRWAAVKAWLRAEVQ
jgi:RNA polymerase sigma factor (TIGR02999 family)